MTPVVYLRVKSYIPRALLRHPVRHRQLGIIPPGCSSVVDHRHPRPIPVQPRWESVRQDEPPFSPGRTKSTRASMWPCPTGEGSGRPAAACTRDSSFYFISCCLTKETGSRPRRIPI
ncbi:hypothetical protein LZ31DRAFT_41751 [Colletotrichum somersetense]|nr:hypothetical protein LZ31DRAFT_41751 [Colletotrichum somersetense]